jgi:NAD(P)-dependent dehydrogenase (short-subunit alcohol dehydrogenase family)
MTLAIVTGANRGIGLSLVKLLKERGSDVLAACRNRSRELDSLDVEIVEGVDVSDPEGVAKLVVAVRERNVDLLINNAGILRADSLDKPNFETINEQLTVNAVAPLRVTAALQKHLKSGAKIAFITSRMGSIDDNSSGGHYGYRMSKAALNMAAKSLSVDLKPAGIAVAILHPGMVKTDMIKGHGQVEPDDAARGLLSRIDELNIDSSGGFWHANGERLPW